MRRYKPSDLIYYETFKNKDINIYEINRLVRENPKKIVVVLIENTTQINEDILNELDPNVRIRIQGPYDLERMEKQKNVNFTDENDVVITSAKKYYAFSVVYTRNEVINILKEIEKIEEGMNVNFSDIQKLYYLCDKIKKSITYDPLVDEKPDAETRSLRGLLSKKTVCAGYAVILKEFLDRQGINSYFLAGNGHAWNVVEIEGKYYPIDLTTENRLYRTGNLRVNDYFGQNDVNFQNNHIPADNDPHKYLMDELSSLDKGFVKYLASSVIKEENYIRTSFGGERINGDKFMLTQIGNSIIGNQVYYTYYFREMNDKYTRIASNPLILTSKVNLCEYVNNVDFGIDNEYSEEFMIKKLLSRENIRDSLRKGSTYIGEIKSYKGTRGQIEKFYKEDKDVYNFPIKYKYITREDNTSILIEIDDYCLRSKDNAYIRYNIYNVSSPNFVVRKRIAYSEMDLLKDKELMYRLFEEKNIEESMKNYNGYLGRVNEEGKIIHTTNFDLFNKDKRVTISGYDKNIKNMVVIPSFEKMKEYYKKYILPDKEYNSLDEVEVLERGNGKKVEDKWTRMNAYISLLWQDAVGNGLEAFNDENREIFNEIKNKIIKDIKENNFINTVELYRSFKDDETKKNIILNLFSMAGKTRIITEYFYKSVKPEGIINGEPVALFSEEFARSLDEESAKRR